MEYKDIINMLEQAEEEIPNVIVQECDEENTVIYNGIKTFGKNFGSLYVIAVPTGDIHYSHLFKILEKKTVDFPESETYLILGGII